MAMSPFAFSVHNFISSIGADAGFAAIIGLAVLVLLYFAHARETANLREEADLLTERLHRAEARVAQLSRAQAAPAPALAAPAPAPPVLAPFAPAGMAAPALASATRVMPLPEPPAVPDAEDSEPESAAAPVAAMAMAGVAASPPRPPASPVPGPLPTAALPTPAPATPAPTDSSDSAVPAPATAAGGNGAGHQPAGPPPRPAEPSWSGQISASRGTSPAAGTLSPIGQLPPLEPRRRRSRIGRGVAIAVVALAAVALAVVLFALTSVGPNKRTPAANTSNFPGPAHSGTAATFKPASVTVAVLNGTSTNQLAHRIGQKLAAKGYKEGTLATAASQTHTTTLVAYTAGTNRRTRVTDRTDALRVARALGLRRSVVQPIDQSTLQVACPAPASCSANVVVTVGADLAKQ